MRRQTISAVLITKNVEDIIEQCLKSISWMDEIILIDSCSADRTVEIAKKYNAKVIVQPFGGDFGEERNLGNAHSTCDWIIQMDADEVMSQGLRCAIEKILNSGSKEYAGYKFRRKNFFLGHFMKYGGWYHYMPQFFRRGYGHFKGRVHHILELKGRMGQIDEDLEHYPFKDLAQFVDRQNRYTTMEAQEIFDLKGILPRKEVIYNLKWKPLKLFWKLYVKKKGFMEGLYGFVFSFLYAWVYFIKWAKYWALVEEAQKAKQNKERGFL